MASPSTANGNAGSTTTSPTSPSSPDQQAQILTSVVSLATLFSHCVEAFNVIHPSSTSTPLQKLALTKLGLEQGRLLIFGDVVGISSPPPTIAKHMIPSHPGATNPDPTLPVNFGVRDPRLDEPEVRKRIEKALNEIVDRPASLSRDEMMEQYGLKAPKKLSAFALQRALDTNRLEAFREKYSLLMDLADQIGGARRGMSMTVQQWQVKDVSKFQDFVKTVREQVDGLIRLMDVKERVDRGMKTDIKAMGWHPDLSGFAVKQDWEKLKRIKEVCREDYPEYEAATETALKYIDQELRESSLSALRAANFRPAGFSSPPVSEKKEKEPEKESPKTPKSPLKRPGFLSHFKFSSWSKSDSKKKDQQQQQQRKSIAGPSITKPEDPDPTRSLSHDLPKTDLNALGPVRSKSLSAIPDDRAPLNLDSKLEPVNSIDSEATTVEPVNTNVLEHADTAHSLIDRHDMYKGVGRVETKDIRGKAHEI